MLVRIRAILYSFIMVPILACSEPALKLQIVELPPYMIVNSPTNVAGLVVDPTVAALKKAGIPFEWQVIPAARQLLRLKNNTERVCSVGWYKTSERELFAKFSHPVLKDSPFVGFANKNFNVKDGVTIGEILSDSKTTVLIKMGFVNGDYLDNKFKTMKARSELSTGDMPLIFKMVEAGRAQITFAPLQEIQYYQDIGVVEKERFNIITFSEMPSGFNRYLMCSQMVEDDLINRFNAALGK